jgi:uncharacterized FAD-dependent dehydrogenase
LNDTERTGNDTQTTADTPYLVKNHRRMRCFCQCPGGTDFYAWTILTVKAA